jgi:hypothetical protein
VEKGFGIVKTIMTAGISGLWQMLLEKIGDIKEMVMTQIKQMVSIEIIKAGIVWLISMLNPASAFVKACKMIYDVVMFFVEKAEQIKAFVDSILDSVESIAAGGVGAVAGYIEKTLGRMVPVIIGFMASLLGLGGISGKIRAILEKIQEPINKAIDWVVGKAVAFGKKALALGKKLLSKAKNLGKKAIGGIKKKLGIKEKTPEQILAAKKKRAQAGAEMAARMLNALPKAVTRLEFAIRGVLIIAKLRHRLTDIHAAVEGDHWVVHTVVNPPGLAPSTLPAKGTPDSRAKDIAAAVALVPAADAAYNAAVGHRDGLIAGGKKGALVVASGGAGTTATFSPQGLGRFGNSRFMQRVGDIIRHLKGTGAIDTTSQGLSAKDAAKLQNTVYLHSGVHVPVEGFRDPAGPAAAVEKVLAGGAAKSSLRGTEKRKGWSDLVHAEKLLHLENPDITAVGIAGAPMCNSCLVYYRGSALAMKKVYVTRDEEGPKAFLTNGLMYKGSKLPKEEAETPTEVHAGG